MNRSLVVAVFAFVLLACIGVAAGSAPSAFPQQDVDPDDVLLSMTVEEGGDAVWTIEYRMRLETDEDEQAFEDLRRDVADDPDPYVDRFAERMDRTAESASAATGRPMAITEMTVSAAKRELPREYGVVTYEFRWSNFAATADDRLLVGDAIDGLFLDEDSALVISWQEDYRLLDVTPTPSETRDRAVVYEGPITFTSGEPRIDLGPPDVVAPDDPDDPARAVPLPVAGAIVVVLVVAVAGGLVLYWRRRTTAPTTPAEAGTPETHSAPTDGPADDPPDDDLLSNEEQVVRLIEREGGRMKQQAVAERLGWTDAKTSQVTKKLREAGDLEGFRLGRENVLSLPEEDGDET